MKHYIVSMISIVLAFILSLWAYPQLPNEIAVHWGVNGEPDGFGAKGFVFLFPGIMLLLLLLKIWMPKVDPKKENYKKFSSSYHISTETITAFFLVIHTASVLVNVGYDIDFESVVFLCVGVLLMVIGNYLPKVKHNYLMGIRTPWTLASETVWYKTHRVGGKGFVLGGILLILSLLFPLAKIWVVLGVVLGLTLFLFVLSYHYYSQEKNEG